jgi:predicted RNA-binding Zn ribbon-like protein
MKVTSVTPETEPAGRPPAPSPLRLVQEFVNTNDIEGGRDRFATTPALRAWLVERRLLPRTTTLDETDRSRAIDVREALRALVISREEAADASAAARRLETAARDAGLALRINARSWDLVASQSGIHPALARILFVVAKAMTDGSWPRLKACRRDACRWVFWDGSRNRSGTWFAMSICGNRANGAAFRMRQGGTRGHADRRD